MGRGAKRLPYGKSLVRVPAVAKFLFDMIFNVNVFIKKFFKRKIVIANEVDVVYIF